MKLKEVIKTEVAEQKKAGATLPIKMFVGLFIIALGFIALLYFFAPGGGQGMGLQAAPVIGMVLKPDMTIAGVDTGGVAQTSGLKTGDKLDKVDGQAVKTLDDAKSKILDDIYNQKEITLTVLRDNQSLDLKLKAVPPKGNSGGPTPTPVPQGYAYF